MELLCQSARRWLAKKFNKFFCTQTPPDYISPMSIRLKSRNQCPPSGFIVTIPVLKATKTFWSFTEAVAWYQGVAMANPQLKLPTNQVIIGDLIDQQNALRCAGIRGGDEYITQKGGTAQLGATKKVPTPAPFPANVVAGVKSLARGAALLFEWEEENTPPASQELADQRASVCVACPLNQKGNLTAIFTEPIANMFRAKFERLNALNLTTQYDSRLHICTACQCPLQLKCFAPLTLINKHLTPETKAKLDPGCWILSEQE